MKFYVKYPGTKHDFSTYKSIKVTSVMVFVDSDWFGKSIKGLCEA